MNEDALRSFEQNSSCWINALRLKTVQAVVGLDFSTMVDKVFSGEHEQIKTNLLFLKPGNMDPPLYKNTMTQIGTTFRRLRQCEISYCVFTRHIVQLYTIIK